VSLQVETKSKTTRSSGKKGVGRFMHAHGTVEGGVKGKASATSPQKASHRGD